MRLLGVVVLTGALLTAGQAHAAPPRAATAPAVTLITGDQVLTGQRAVRPAPGREHVLFTTYTAGGHEFVVPSDAMPLIANGRLDERLFDITELASYGGALPVIVTYPQGTLRAQSEGLQLPSINGVAFDAARTPLAGGLSASGARKIWLDARRTANLDRSVAQINAPAAYAAGFTGKGTTVAVLDTGVDQTHPDLADREIGERNFTTSPDAADRYGHGTHVASIIAGTGAKSGGKYRGVAPDARILDVKVLGDNGSGQDSQIIAGMEWAVGQGAQIVNMSLGGYDTPEIEPLEEAVNRLTADKGTLFVVAAGNSGPNGGTVGSPGSADQALTVGAVDEENRLAEFSSRGPTRSGTLKPDLTAPGVGIVAALHADGRIGPPVADGYTSLDGTSMATPHVAGAAALLHQQHPDLNGTRLKARLTGSTTPTERLTPFEQGSGRVDVAKLITQNVTSNPTGVSLGAHRWPHTGKPAPTKEITYTNAGAEPVTLDLTTETNGSLFSVSPAKLTVPAGGAATIDLDARQARPVEVKLPVTAQLSLLQTGFERVVNGTSYTVGNFSVGGNIAHLAMASLGPDSPEVTGKIATFWTAGPDFYGLAWYRTGSAPNGLTKTVAKKDLATVKLDLPALKEGQNATIGHTSAPAGRADWGYGSLDNLAPGPRTEYYGGEGGDWSRRFNLFDENGNIGALAGPLKHYRAGRSYLEPFNHAVFGPALPESRDIPHSFRTGDFVRITVPLYGDNAGNEGYGPVTDARTTLYRDNVKAGETAEAGWGGLGRVRRRTGSRELPPGGDGDPRQPVEHQGFRCLEVPQRQHAEADRATAVRVTSVDVSYDGGTTWRSTPITAGRVLLAHPKDAKSVSLRAKASGQGQTVEQTIVNAYRLR